MPVVFFAVAAYIAGLYAGFSARGALAALVVVAAFTFGTRRGVAVAAGYTALTLAGVLAARAASIHDTRCAAAASRAAAVTVVVADGVAPGGFSTARLPDCPARVSVSVTAGAAPGGATVVARGEIAASERGILVQHATVRLIRGPPLLARLRAAAGRRIDAAFGDDAPLVRALLIADRSGLAPEVRDRFAAAGLAHILAIAGLHIGIIAMAIALAFELAGIPRQQASVATVVAIVAYVTLIGAPIPAVRAATMLSVLLLTRWMQRPTSRWAIVAIGAAQAIVEPRVVLDVGYQLSVVGVAAMICSGLLGRRLGVHRLPPLRKHAAVTLLGTTAATIATAPIVALTFGRISLVAPLSNLAATPLIALAQPMIFFGLLVSPLPFAARFIGDAAHPLLVALDTVARLAAAVPGGAPSVAPSTGAAVLAGVMAIAVLVACASAEWHQAAGVAVASAAAIIWLPLAPAVAGDMEIHMIDVGQGDAIALRTPHNHWVLIDAGGAWRDGDAGRSTVAPYLGRRGGVLDLFILSHPHTDHVGGAPSVLRALHPAAYIDGGFPGPADAYPASLHVARATLVRWRRAHPGDELTIDGVRLRTLAPDSAWTAGLTDPNLASVVVLATFGNVRALFMGDAERPEEDWLLAHEAGALDGGVDILKVGHHGSGTSSTEAFVDAVHPRLALVSVGAGNSYHLPTPAVMQRLAAHRAQVLRTDRLGTVVVRTDGRRIWLAAAGDEWELPPPLPASRTP
jgi:competence protein ComEC